MFEVHRNDECYYIFDKRNNNYIHIPINSLIDYNPDLLDKDEKVKFLERKIMKKKVIGFNVNSTDTIQEIDVEFKINGSWYQVFESNGEEGLYCNFFEPTKTTLIYISSKYIKQL